MKVSPKGMTQQESKEIRKKEKTGKEVKQNNRRIEGTTKPKYSRKQKIKQKCLKKREGKMLHYATGINLTKLISATIKEWNEKASNKGSRHRKRMQEQSLFKERSMNLKERTDSNSRIQWKRSNGMNLNNQRKE